MPAAVASEAPMGENTAPMGIKGVACLTPGAAEKVVKREAQDDEGGNSGSGGEKRHEDGGQDDDYRGNAGSHHGTLWTRSTKNPDVSTGPLARPFAWLLAPLTRSLVLHYPLRSRTLLRSLRSLPRSWDSESLDGYSVFFSVVRG